MSTYAIIETGGKQYRVEKGQTLLVDRMPADEGAKVALRAVMLRTDDDVVLGADELEKVKVEAKVAGHERGEKIKVFTYKAKKGQSKRRGHRSELTRLEVTEVKQLTRKPAAKKEDEAPAKQSKAAPKETSAPAARQSAGEEAAAAEPTPAAEGLPEGIGKPATRALEEAGLTSLEKVSEKTEAELLALHGIGPKAVEVLAAELASAGLELKQTDESEESD
jgi:large subunit ribosomal protein L21